MMGNSSSGSVRMRLVDNGIVERRRHRRHEMEDRRVMVERFDGPDRPGKPLGVLVDISSGGICIRTREKNIRPDQQIRIRLELPPFAGICPFIRQGEQGPEPSRSWAGWVAVSRVTSLPDGHFEIAGRLVDMDELDRGMLGLYLSTQPLAA